MKLHAPHKEPDWMVGDAKAATFWQRLALRTNGVVTLANFLSVIGLVLVICGAWLLASGGRWTSGVFLVAVGRLFDILDGYVAELTKTKSQLGGTVDVICDKLAMTAILIAATYAYLAWPWFLVLLVTYNVYLAYFGMLYGRVHHIYPNIFAKLSSFVGWVAIFLSVFHSKEPTAWFTVGAGVAVTVWSVISGLALRTYHQELAQATQEKRVNSDWAHEISNLVCVVNPHATHYRQASRLLVLLGKVLHTVPTEVDITEHEQVLTKLLAAGKQDKKVLIAIAGGDGTVSTVINTLLRSQDHYQIGQCILLPLWGGNANDFACMLNGLRLFIRPKKLISRAALVAVPLIKLTIRQTGKSPQTIYAACYASFGATAYAARQLETRRFSTKKLLQWFPPLLVGREFVAVVKALVSTPQYTSEIDEKQQAFYEHSLINGSRIAKINRVPVKLHQPYFLHASITRKDPSVIISLLRMASGKPAPEYAMQSQLSFKLVTAVDAQIDGEVMHISAGAQVSAASVQTSLQFIGTKIK